MILRSTSPLSALLLVAACASVAGCTDSPRSADNVRERTADATAVIKNDVKAAAQGVKEGLSRHSGEASDRKANAVDLNNASAGELQVLPGITHALAAAIIAGRPYNDPVDLRKRHILTAAEYNRVATRVTTTP